ncbi:MAG TPA: hypothetical protein VIS99_03770, partial [Terrimicrobiaceae bacterium]
CHSPALYATIFTGHYTSSVSDDSDTPDRRASACIGRACLTCSRIIYYAALVRTRNVTSFADHPLIHAIDRPKTYSMNLDFSFLASPEVFFGLRLHDLGAAGVNALGLLRIKLVSCPYFKPTSLFHCSIAGLPMDRKLGGTWGHFFHAGRSPAISWPVVECLPSS